MAVTETIDGRRQRGDATRRAVAGAAARIATVGGLDSITVGGLAAETGVSKSGILTVFGSRENIQVAAVAEARKIIRAQVFAPVWGLEPGRPRLEAFLHLWRDHLRDGMFPGGCFLAKVSVEYGHREGPVAESIQRLKREWLDLLEAELGAAGHADPPSGAFQIDAYLTAGNARHELFGDPAALQRGLDLALAVIP